jgi:hypothetical protein
MPDVKPHPAPLATAPIRKKHATRCFTSHRKETHTGAPLLRPRATGTGYLTSPGGLLRAPDPVLHCTAPHDSRARRQRPKASRASADTRTPHLPIADPFAHTLRTPHALHAQLHCTARSSLDAPLPPLTCAACAAQRFPPPRTDHRRLSAPFAASPGPWIRARGSGVCFPPRSSAPMHEVISRAARCDFASCSGCIAWP